MNVDKICEELIWYGKRSEENHKYEIYISIDFDFCLTKISSWATGEIVKNDSCFDILKKWEKEFNCKYILDTMRTGDNLRKAVDFINENGIELYGIGKNPLQDADGQITNKSWAVFSIDDRNCMIPLICPKDSRPYVNWYVLEAYMTPILRKISKRIDEIEERVLEAKRLATEENKYVEIDYSY